MRILNVVREHTYAAWMTFSMLSAGALGLILRNVLGQMSMDDQLMVSILACIGAICVSADFCNVLVHYADAVDYIKENPLVEFKEAWKKTKPDLYIGDEDF